MNSDPLLDARDVSFAYRDAPVLRGVSLALAPGEVVALLGPNGSGKSTLLRVLLGQLPGGAGTVNWQGRAVGNWPRRQLARLVAYLPQTPTFEPGQTVAEVLRLGRSPYWGAFGLESAEDGRVVADVARSLALDDLLARPADELSGGQRQRVFVGRCLAQQPAALLLDEPGTFLDLRHQVELLHLLRRLAHEAGLAVLMASHDLNVAAAMADRLILLNEGTVAAEGPPARVLEPEMLRKVYGVPMERIERGDGRAPLVIPDLK